MYCRAEVFFLFLFFRETLRNRISVLLELQLFHWKRGVGRNELCSNSYCICIKSFEISLPMSPSTYVLLVEEKKVLRKIMQNSQKNMGLWWVA